MALAGVYEAWATAHADLMNATGWDTLVTQLVAMVKSAPDDLAEVAEDVVTYIRVVGWQEHFFWYLGAAHALLFMAVIFFTWGPISDTRLELTACGLLILAQSALWLNPLGRRHVAELFDEPRKMYFDEAGIFVTVFLWAPIMCLAVGVLLRFVVRFVRLLGQVAHKRATVQRTTHSEAAITTPSTEAAGPQQPDTVSADKKQQ